MRSRNLYVVLGISPQASQEAIRSAYRTLAKRYHPDHMGPSGAARFHEASEAYRVLSDPESRRAHNRELDLPAAAGPAPEPLTYPRQPFAEPLTEPFSLRRSLHVGRPSLEDEFLDWTMRHFTDRRLAKSGRHQRIDVEVVLSREEAERGGFLPVQIPAFSVCPACDGRGRDWFSDCPRCGGQGTVEGSLTLRLRIPALVRDGTVWAVPVLDAGLDLRILIRIDPLN
jgi:molecular chaperone DnaJ